MFFWNSFAFSMIQPMLAIWSLVPLPFLNPAWKSGSSQFTYCWSLVLGILSITLCESSAIVEYFEHSLALPFFGIGMKTDLFQSCGHCWVFQICFHISCSTLTASSFRIWNSSTGIPSPPLDFFYYFPLFLCIDLLGLFTLTSSNPLPCCLNWVGISDCLDSCLLCYILKTLSCSMLGQL